MMRGLRAMWNALRYPMNPPEPQPPRLEDEVSGDIRQALQVHASSSRLLQKRACETAHEAEAMAASLAERVQAHKAQVIAAAEEALRLLQEKGRGGAQ